MQLSIIMPAYNEENTIVKVLHSLIQEVPEVCEIIVVDDGSMDRTAQLAELIAQQYPENKSSSPAKKPGQNSGAASRFCRQHGGCCPGAGCRHGV